MSYSDFYFIIVRNLLFYFIEKVRVLFGSQACIMKVLMKFTSLAQAAESHEGGIFATNTVNMRHFMVH